MGQEGFINSAVVVLIVPHNGIPYDLILIRRTKREHNKHTGEMGFAGGKVEEEDETHLNTALRELKEELAIP